MRATPASTYASESVPWLVAFDLDGTLIDSSEDLCRSVNAALEHVGTLTLEPKVITSYVGDGAAMLIQRSLGAGATALQQEKALRFFLDFYRVHKLDTTRLYPGVLEALRHIRALAPALPMAVLTNKPVRPSREICDALGVSPFLFAVLGGDSLSTKKPHPAGLMDLMAGAQALIGETSKPSLKAEGVVLIGDSDVDVQTARFAGAKSLGCLYGLARDKLMASGPDATCTSAAEWPQKLGFLA